jgi:hypothetical protein
MNTMTNYLWGNHRIKGWMKLQGPASVEVMEQYKPYFEHDKLADYYANVPFSGFAGDERNTYTSLVVAVRKPKGGR